MIPRKFKISFDFSTEGTNNVWGAHAITMEECGLGDDSVSRVEYVGISPMGWPILEVTFADILSAQVYIHVYLGNDPGVYNIYTMDDMWEYFKMGEFVME